MRGGTTRVGKLTIDLCIVDGVPGCATECYPSDEWDVVKTMELGSAWPDVDQQYEAVKDGVEALVWTRDTWFGLRRKDDRRADR